MAWSDDAEELKRIKNDVAASWLQWAACRATTTTDCPTLFWAGIPGNAADFPAEEAFHTFIGQAVCLFAGETNYKDSPSAFGIRMADRISGKPLHIDISDLPMSGGVDNEQKQVRIGPFGKRQVILHEPPCQAVLRTRIPRGAGRYGQLLPRLCEMIHRKTKGKDGIYFTYTEESPSRSTRSTRTTGV